MFPKVILDEDFEENGKCYVYTNKEITFWVSDGIVDSLTIFPEYNSTGEIPIWPKRN